MTVFRRCIVAGIIGAGAFATNATAQISVEAGPLAGYYTANPGRMDNAPNDPGEFSGPAVGAELSAWSKRRFGLRLEAARTFDDRQETTNPGGFTPTMSGGVIAASVQAAVALLENSSDMLWLGVGPGLVHHFGDAFAASRSPTDAAITAGLGETHSLAGGLRLVLGASALHYSYSGVLGDIGGPPPGRPGHFGTRAYTDVLIHAGLTWTGG